MSNMLRGIAYASNPSLAAMATIGLVSLTGTRNTCVKQLIDKASCPVVANLQLALQQL